MEYVPCPECHRHHRAHETHCPFCGARPVMLPRAVLTGALVVAGAGLAALLCACYGPPPRSLEVVHSPNDLVGSELGIDPTTPNHGAQALPRPAPTP
jgi:hypothetical protein